MSLWAKLFGNDDIVDKGAEAIDKSFYTNEEKADNWSRFLTLYEPFKIAQRWLMLVVCPSYVLMTLTVCSLELYSEMTNKEWDFTKSYNLLNGDIGTAFVMIVVFYFGGGALEGVVNRFKVKRYESKNK